MSAFSKFLPSRQHQLSDIAKTGNQNVDAVPIEKISQHSQDQDVTSVSSKDYKNESEVEEADLVSPGQLTLEEGKTVYDLLLSRVDLMLYRCCWWDGSPSWRV